MKQEFISALPVLRKIESAGFEAYFVGGAVRDQLLNRPVHDIDIATSATPEEVKGIFQKTIDVGIEHGTVVVLAEKGSYEITTFRSESEYVDFRHPSKVSFIRSLRDDLARRDFTINAMAMDAAGKIYDYFSGQADLERKLVRAVNDPSERFNEDALRMLRAIRFQGQLGFIIEPDTSAAICLCAENIRHISQERVTTEIEKILLGRYNQQAIDTLIETGMHHVLPGLSQLTPLSFGETTSLAERWSVLLIHLGAEPKSFLQQWRCSNDLIKQVQAIVVTVSVVERLGWNDQRLFEAGLLVAKAAEHVMLARQMSKSDYDIDKAYRELPIKEASALAVGGSDLITWSAAPAGPWIKEALEQLTEAIIARQLVNEKEQLKEWLIQNKLIQMK